MTSTTSLKLPDDLKAQIAEAAKQEGKTAHALMVETLQTAMNETRLRNQFYQEAMQSKADMVSTNIAYSHDEIAQWARRYVRGDQQAQPKAHAYDPSKPMQASKRASKQ